MLLFFIIFTYKHLRNKQMFDTILQIKNNKLEMIIMSNLHAEEYKSFEEIKKLKKMEQNIGVQES